MKYYCIKFNPGMYASLFLCYYDKILSRPGENELLVVGLKPWIDNTLFFFETSYYDKIIDEYYAAKDAGKLVEQEKDHHWVSFWYFMGKTTLANEEQYKGAWDYSKGVRKP